MGEIPHSEKMFHLPIEVAVYVPSTQDVDKVVSKSEMKSRVDEVKKFLASLFGGFSSAPVEGGFLASDGKVVKENVEKVVSFAPKEDFDKNKEALVRQASEWASRWGQEAIGLEHEGDLYYVPQKFESGGNIAIREAKEMANSQALEIKHHASELANALKGNPTIEAWVIAKLERASNDLADVTHYLEGRVQMSGKKMANGGNLSEKMIKVKVVYLEQQYFELTKEMEIPFSVYKEYDKTGKVPRELTDDLISETTIEHHVETNPISVRLTPVTSSKMKSGGEVLNNDPQFIKHNGEEIMFVPAFKTYYVNDVEFNTLDEAKSFIDKGAPMSDEIKEGYRKGLFSTGGSMKFERPTYKSNYVASQAQADELADENWNMDYENDPIIKAQRNLKERSEKAKELATRAGMAYATRGASEMGGSGQGADGGKPDISALLKGMKK